MEISAHGESAVTQRRLLSQDRCILSDAEFAFLSRKIYESQRRGFARVLGVLWSAYATTRPRLGAKVWIE